MNLGEFKNKFINTIGIYLDIDEDNIFFNEYTISIVIFRDIEFSEVEKVKIEDWAEYYIEIKYIKELIIEKNKLKFLLH